MPPQISFLESARSHQILEEREPFECIRYGKAFSAKSTIAHLVS